MTAQEAIVSMETARIMVELESPIDYQFEYHTAFDMAIKALEKRVPKKPIDMEGEIIKYDLKWKRCPVCGAIAGSPQYDKDISWCRECGQAIDWQEVTE